MSATENGATVRPPYATESQIRTFFERMKNMGEPSKVDTKWLESFNLGGAQPTAVIGLLKWLGIIEPVSGASTGIWTQLRTKQSETLRNLVEKAYAPVFEAVEVTSADREALSGAFIHAYQSGDTGRPLTAFITLCSIAGIELPAAQQKGRAAPPPRRATSPRTAKSASSKPAPAKTAQSHTAQMGTLQSDRTATGSTVSVTFNVDIPGDWDGERVRERISDVLDALRSGER